jgi:hypothetical protein|tara:strand:- start:3138 stop:3251 length:114 start_codon:yes stop_codon:yes gene_type:complete
MLKKSLQESKGFLMKAGLYRFAARFQASISIQRYDLI